MTRHKRFTALLLAVAILLFSTAVLTVVTSFAATAAVNYSFTGSASTKRGYAQGTITVTPTAGNYGTYYLYWGNSSGALGDYSNIAAVNASSGSGSYSMPQYTAIPADATHVLAFMANSEPSVANRTFAKASATYEIPSSKRLTDSSSDALYSFGAVSDIQLANGGSSSYPNDKKHYAAALESLKKRGVNFTVTSGDTVNDQNGNSSYYKSEYDSYQKILADSGYCNPFYEAIGNHELWAGASVGTAAFITATGLDSDLDSISSGKAYYEITEPNTGDHFIFMALEANFYPDRTEEFSNAQLDWLEGLLKKYSTDGKNIFILEHSNINGWGSGDRLSSPFYDIPLQQSQSSTSRLISLLKTYKKCVVITGHTHIHLEAQYNYSDNAGTSAVMMHNSAVGGVRQIENGSMDRTPVLGLSQGYIVEVYPDCILFNGANLYSNEIIPSCSYIIPFTTSGVTPPKPTASSTPAKPTVPSTPATTSQPTATAATTTLPSTPVITSSVAPTEPVRVCGDADQSGLVSVRDATLIQRHCANLYELSPTQRELADVDADTKISVKDATMIQKYCASMISSFPAEKSPASVGAVAGEPAELGADFSQALTDARANLDLYYRFSSYDQYMALKKAYLSYSSATLTPAAQTAAATDLAEKQSALHAIADSPVLPTNPTPDTDIDVYYTDVTGWSQVKAYLWGSGGNNAWPGSAMTYVGKNSQNQSIYKISVSFDKYQNVIFTDGSTQTTDIALTGQTNVGYYQSGTSGGKIVCSTYTFTQSTIK